MALNRKPNSFDLPQHFRKLPTKRYRKNQKNQKTKTLSIANKTTVVYTEDGFIVTTLYLKSLGRKLKHDDILSYFATFGVVQNVRIYNKPTHYFGFVTFAQPEIACKVLLISSHTIAGHRTKIAVADSWHQELRNNDDASLESSSGTEMTLINVTRTNLLDLNDDCFYEVFSLKFISLMDLCSVAECSIRLKQIACQIFALSHKNCNLNSLRLNTIHEVRRLMMNFGPVITEILIAQPVIKEFDKLKENRVMDLIIRYCGKTLKSLYLIDYEITSQLSLKLKPLFKKLQKLCLKNCSIEGAAKQLFANCRSMVVLKLFNLTNYTRDDGIMLNNLFPKLEIFKYGDYDDYDYSNLHVFISQHKRLKTLSLKEFDADYTSLLPVIAESCKQLQKLQIDCQYEKPINKVEFENSLKNLLALDKLQKLKINCLNQNITKFLQDATTLKSLELWNVRGGDSGFIPALCQLQHLHKLRLCHCEEPNDIKELGDLEQLTELSIRFRGESAKHDFDIVQLIKRLPNLKNLIIEWDKFKLDKVTYLQMVNIVRNRHCLYKTPLEIKSDTIESKILNLQYDDNNDHYVKLHKIDFSDNSDDDFIFYQ